MQRALAADAPRLGKRERGIAFQRTRNPKQPDIAAPPAPIIVAGSR
jgi:hypothetical protein